MEPHTQVVLISVGPALQITPGSIAESLGLKIRDVVLKINGESAANVTSKEADERVVKGSNNFALEIER